MFNNILNGYENIPYNIIILFSKIKESKIAKRCLDLWRRRGRWGKLTNGAS